MRIHYETKVEDLREWRRFYLNLPEIRAIVKGRRVTRGALVAVSIFVMFTVTYQNPWAALMCAVAAVMLFLLLLTLAERRQWRAVLQSMIENRDGMSILGKNTLEITDESVAESFEFFSYAFHWDVVKHVCFRPGYVFFVLQNHRGIIVPLESIEPLSDREPFLERLERCMPVDLRGDTADS